MLSEPREVWQAMTQWFTLYLTYRWLLFDSWQDSSGNGYTSGTVTGVTFNSYSATMLGTNNGFQLNSAFVTAFKTLTEFTIMCFVSASNVSAWLHMQYANINLWSRSCFRHHCDNLSYSVVSI